MWMILFFVLPIAGLSYVLWHVWALLPVARLWRVAAMIVGVLPFVAMVLNFSRTIDRMPLWLGRVCYEVGNSSIFVLLYVVLIFLLLDLGRLVRLVPGSWLHSNATVLAVIVAATTGLFVYGYAHYLHKERVAMSVEVAKPLERGVRIVALTDLHLGYHNPRTELRRWVDMVNRERPDVVILVGDVVDWSLRPLREESMADELRRIEAPVYAAFGNHEMLSNGAAAARFYADAGITLLRDSVATVKGLTIIGRDDRSNRRRKSLRTLTEGIDKDSTAIICIDHQPYNLEEAEAAGIDLQISGHTHDGQLWPISLITRSLYECAHGPWQRGTTHYYVSSGIGIWGAKFRIGTQSEYLVAEVSSEGGR